MIKNLKVFTQITDSHCGPATIQMLLNFVGVHKNQDQIVSAARARSRVDKKGVKPEQLARAVKALAPQMNFWIKQNATAKDLDIVVNTYKYPICVNWQSLFFKSLEEEKKLLQPGDDPGHYAICTGVDIKKDKIYIQDPYPTFAQKIRIFSLKWFKSRWWDVIYEKDPKTKQKLSLYTKHAAFLITPKTENFPQKLHFTLIKDFQYL